MKKIDKRGFTVVELLTSFSLATVVMVFLFNILISIKEGYINHKILSEANTDQAFISRIINEDARNYVLTDEPTFNNSKTTLTLPVECVSSACNGETQIKYVLSGNSFLKKLGNTNVDEYTCGDNTSISASSVSGLKEFGNTKFYMITYKVSDYNVIVYFPAK